MPNLRRRRLPDYSLQFYILPRSTKECNYGARASQTNSSLTKFILNGISAYLSKKNLLLKYNL